MALTVTENTHNFHGLEINFQDMAPLGYFYALQIGFAFPLEQMNTLPPSWVNLYTEKKLFFSDPIMRWGYTQLGIKRWSDLVKWDEEGVLEIAKSMDLNFGCVAACIDNLNDGRKSIAILARSDREYTDAELNKIERFLQKAHNSTASLSNITEAELEALGMIIKGMRLKEIAFQLGVTEGAVKQRLKNAKSKLGATTSAQAASLASSLGLV